MVSFFDSGWYHQIWRILYTSKVIKCNTCVYCQDQLVLRVACSPILSVTLEGMCCEPALNLAAIPDEAVSIICTVVEKLYLQLSVEVYVCKLYYQPTRVFRRASWRFSSFDLSLGSLTRLTYAYGMCCHNDVAPGDFLLIQCACQFFWTGHFNSCMCIINCWLLYHQAAW